MSSQSETGPIIESIEASSPHNKALYDAGKKMLVDSLDVTRDFCKFMTTTSLGAIPTYIALLKLVLPKDHSLIGAEWIYLIAPVAFLVSAVLFVFALLPKKLDVCLDYPGEIDTARHATLGRRRVLSRSGFGIFCGGVLLAAWQLVAYLV